MARKYFTAEQIISKLREAEVLLSQGKSTAEVCRSLSVSEQTYYRWRKEYGGMKRDQAKRYKELELENTRLKKIVADQSLDIAILKEAEQTAEAIKTFKQAKGQDYSASWMRQRQAWDPFVNAMWAKYRHN